MLGASCSAPAPAAGLPVEVHGGWRITSRSAAPGIPEALKTLAPKRGEMIVYDGPSLVRMEAYEMPTPTSAFEAMQRWHADGKKVPLHLKQYFLLLSTDHPNKAMLNDFIDGLRKGV
jgi:hypothetical protein